MSEQNACIDCRHYEKCGRPERTIKCMGYEQKEREEHGQKKDR